MLDQLAAEMPELWREILVDEQNVQFTGCASPGNLDLQACVITGQI